MDVDLGFDGCGFGVLKGIWVEMKKKKRKKMKKKKVTTTRGPDSGLAKSELT